MITLQSKKRPASRKNITARKKMYKSIASQKWQFKNGQQHQEVIMYNKHQDSNERIAIINPYIYDKPTETELYQRGRLIAIAPLLLAVIISQIDFLKKQLKKVPKRSNFVSAEDFEKINQVTEQNKIIEDQIAKLEQTISLV